MTKDKEMKAVFIMMQDMKAQIQILNDKVKALSEAEPRNSKCFVHCKQVETFQEEVKNLVDFQITETAKVEAELDLIDTGMERLFHRTNDLQERQAEQVDKCLELETRFKKLSAPKAQSFSVTRQNIPQFARSSADRRSKPEQIRWPRERICYNCRHSGHFAKDCKKPNPRQPLSDNVVPKPTLSSILKKKQP